MLITPGYCGDFYASQRSIRHFAKPDRQSGQSLSDRPENSPPDVYGTGQAAGAHPTRITPIRPRDAIRASDVLEVAVTAFAFRKARGPAYALGLDDAGARRPLAFQTFAHGFAPGAIG